MHGCTQLGRAISQAANANRRDGAPAAGSFTCTPRGQAGQRVGTHGRTGRRPALPYSEPRVMSPARMSTFIYVSGKHGTGCGRRQPEGQSRPGSQPPPPPTPREEGRECPFSRASVFLSYEKGGKGDRGTGQVELHAASFIPVRKGALRTGPGDASRSRDSLCGRLVTWRADSSLRGRQGGEVRCVPVWPLPLRERRGPGHSA